MADQKSTVLHSRNLLVEIGTEEMPPGILSSLARSLADEFFKGLKEAAVVSASSAYRCYATSRRLAVWIQDVMPRQQDRIEARRGPSIKAAFDENAQPTQAALGFAKSCGVSVSALRHVKTDNGERLVFEHRVPGDALDRIVERCLARSVRQLPIPKRMKWGSHDIEFVRPVHGLLVLYGSERLKVECMGLKASRTTRGHRFHTAQALAIPSADRYVDTLKSPGYVLADYDLRKSTIERQIRQLAAKVGAVAVIDPDLLDFVTGLVEWPQALMGEFDRQFLAIPAEVLICSMSDHQKYFHLVDERGQLLPRFITISNLESKSPKSVIRGNERVLRARLADAEFFWDSDQRIALQDRVESLKKVMFHHKLGSVYQKTERVEQLSRVLARRLQREADSESISRAAWLCKADLVTELVSEFPKLQGVIGRYYALRQGENEQVATAIDAHYLPRFAGDQLPDDPVSQCLALADRLDTLVGIFSCGEIPSGDKDPFALRRAAMGVLRILIEKKINLDIHDLLKVAFENYQGSTEGFFDHPRPVHDQVFEFLLDRLNAYYQAKGFRADEIASILACRPTRPYQFDNRLKALSAFFREQKDAAQSLAAVNKRIANILAKQDNVLQADPDKALVMEPAERELIEQLRKVERRLYAAKVIKEVEGQRKLSDQLNLSVQQYGQVFQCLVDLKAPVDAFFDQVLVMDPDLEVRHNRLALLSQLRRLFLQVADISVMRYE